MLLFQLGSGVFLLWMLSFFARAVADGTWPMRVPDSQGRSKFRQSLGDFVPLFSLTGVILVVDVMLNMLVAASFIRSSCPR